MTPASKMTNSEIDAAMEELLRPTLRNMDSDRVWMFPPGTVPSMVRSQEDADIVHEWYGRRGFVFTKGNP